MDKIDNDFLLIRNNTEGRYTTLNMYKNGEKVSSLSIIDYNINIGKSAVRVAGIGGVNTEEKFQKQGFMRILIESAIDFINNNGYSISILLGIPNFYSKFNYFSILPEVNITTKLSYFKDYDFNTFPLLMRDFNFKDCKNIIELYNRNKLNCNIIRKDESFFGFLNGSRIGVKSQTFIFTNSDDEFIGYIVLDNLDNEINITEIEVVDNKYYETLLKHLIEIGKSKNIKDFSVFLPKEHSFVKLIKNFGYSITSVYYHFEKGMLRIHNLFQFFMEIKEELHSRLKNSNISSFDLDIITEIASLNIKLKSKELLITRNLNCQNSIKLPSSDLIQFIVGYKSWDEVLVNANSIETIGDSNLITYLASQIEPFLWRTDYF